MFAITERVLSYPDACPFSEFCWTDCISHELTQHQLGFSSSTKLSNTSYLILSILKQSKLSPQTAIRYSELFPYSIKNKGMELDCRK